MEGTNKAHGFAIFMGLVGVRLTAQLGAEVMLFLSFATRRPQEKGGCEHQT